MTVYSALLIAAGLLANSAVIAAVYKSVDADGNVVYTDEPVGNARPVDLPPLSTIPPPKAFTPPADIAEQDAATGYEKLQVVSPEQDATLRDNTGNVAVSVAAEPALDLKAGHRVQFYLDGQTAGDPGNSLKKVFQNVDRGAHTVEAAIVDQSGTELIRSAGTRFYLHRQSVNFPRGPASPTPFAR